MKSTRVAAAALAASVVSTAFAADHRDGSIAQDQPADIADTYAFVNPNDTDKVILGVTVNPYTVPGVTASFSTDLLYQIKIDNNGDFREDLVIQALFDPLASAAQQFEVRGPARPHRRGAVNFLVRRAPTFEGPSNGSVQEFAHGDVRIFSGRTDDPFFIDLIFVRSVLNVPGIPSLADFSAASRVPGGVGIPALGLTDLGGIDLFTGLNVSALMIELPKSWVQHGKDSKINVWSTVSRQAVTVRSDRRSERSFGPWVQIDREGLPAINAALVPPDRRDAFNRSGSPRSDMRRFGKDIAKFLANKPNIQLVFGNDDADELAAAIKETILPALLPDVLRLDLGIGPDPDTGIIPGLEIVNGEGSFNGRAPRDDFIDLFLLVLSNGFIPSDGLAANDCTPQVPNLATGEPVHPAELTCAADSLSNGFPTVFPFLGAEHQPREAIAPRDGPEVAAE